MRHVSPKSLLLFLAALLLASCSAAPVPTAAPPTEEPGLPLPTPRPTATALVFELRPSSTPEPSPTPLPTDQVPGFGYGPTSFPEDINPLTGLRPADPTLLFRRPMVIKISNFPRQVRPQWGLTLADHVYEYYLEAGLTRFMGVFYGQDASQVGPVRSARFFDLHVVRMYKAIFAFAYADDPVIDELMNSEMSDLVVVRRDDNCPPMCRLETGEAYNNLFTNTAQLSQYITQRGDPNQRQNLDGLRFEASSILLQGGGQGLRAAFRYSDYSYNLWEYDPITQRYLRSQEADTRVPGQEVYQPLVDSLTGQQIAADNLVVLLVPTAYYLKSHSTEIFTIDLTGEGDAYALRQGRIYKLRWKRNEPGALLSLEFSPGLPYPLKPGNVWFQVLGETSAYRKLSEADWEFTFSIP